MKISLIQNAVLSCEKDNFKQISNQIKQLPDDVELVVLFELHDDFYFCQSKDKSNYKKAKPISYFIDKYKELAILKKCYLVLSVYEKDIDLYNTAIVLNPKGELIHKYRKTHIPSCDEYNETFYFKHGEDLSVVKTDIGNIGVLICYDQWFPENARKLAKLGADIIVIPTSIGFNHKDSYETKNKELQAWITMHKAHAISNGIYVAVCNRVGFEKGNTGIDFWGHSSIFGPFGETVASLKDERKNLTADVDFREIGKIRRTWPFLQQISKIHE